MRVRGFRRRLTGPPHCQTSPWPTHRTQRYTNIIPTVSARPIKIFDPVECGKQVWRWNEPGTAARIDCTQARTSSETRPIDASGERYRQKACSVQCPRSLPRPARQARWNRHLGGRRTDRSLDHRWGPCGRRYRVRQRKVHRPED